MMVFYFLSNIILLDKLTNMIHWTTVWVFNFVALQLHLVDGDEWSDAKSPEDSNKDKNDEDDWGSGLVLCFFYIFFTTFYFNVFPDGRRKWQLRFQRLNLKRFATLLFIKFYVCKQLYLLEAYRNGLTSSS